MNKGTVLMSINVTKNGQCSLCKESHRLINCQKFRKLSPNQRFEQVKNWNRCVNCFALGHRKDKCPSTFSCRLCQRRHHTLLHNGNYAQKVSAGNQGSRPPTQSSPVENKSISSGPTQPQAHTIISNHTSSKNGSTSSSKETTKILLATARARIRGKNGNFCSVRILIDSGSQRSFITADCAKRLNLPRIHNTQRLVGLGQQTIAGGNQQITVTIIPENREEPEFSTNAIIMDRICENIPSCKIASNVSQYLKLDHLADPTYCEPGPIDFLLGADLFGEVFLGDTLTLPDGFPNCYKTVFGWIFMGKVLAPTPKSYDLALCVFKPESEDLKVLVEKFWIVEVERVSRIDPLDAKCEDHFKRTHSRDPTGRYVVELPFKDPCPLLGNSKTGAITRFHKLEQRLSKDPNLKSKYNEVFSEYLKNNYLSPAQELGKFYLPHQAVLKNDVSKIRVVFDASHSTSTGSLNDKLIQGPKLQTDIKDILLKFRNPRFAIATDICQMYSQILVQDKDRAYQHLYFRFNPNDAIVDYTFNRVTFGMTCSPYLALRVLRQLVIDEGSPFALASKALEKKIYMDDILAGADSVEATLELQQQLIELLKKGGFTLKKWSSNVDRLLDSVPPESRSNHVPLSDLEDTVVKILGMQWETHNDSLTYKIQMRDCDKTKLGILSTIARMYDPLGYLSPVIFRAKTILQRLWQLNVDWDETPPTNIANEWETFLGEIPALKAISIPRCILPPDPEEISIMGFADASSLGYAAVVYLRIRSSEGLITNRLLYAKTRLAPTKPLSIPRLELCAALLLAIAMRSLTDYFSSLTISKMYLFSDSKTVLSWLQLPFHQLKMFVANRVAKFLDITPLNAWHHVKSEDNMADIASRGTNPISLTSENAWWSGAEWQSLPKDEWPVTPIQNHSVENDLPETKDVVLLVSSNDTANPEELVRDFSSFPRMLRVFSYMRRWKMLIKGQKKLGAVSLGEIQETLDQLVREIQKHHFQGDYAVRYKSLAPFVDTHGIVRVCTHPILLPNKSDFVNLLIDYLHVTYCHAGPQLLFSLIKRRYWIVSGRKLVRHRVHLCVRCHRLRTTPYEYQMSRLPLTRFEQGRAFINVGVDFAGPFPIKESSRRKAALGKAYFGIFICMSTKAIHVELVSRLSTDAFLASLDRFIARRGLPSRIFSDNGRNFVGANRHLKELGKWPSEPETQAQISQHLCQREVQWAFIPPAAPHFGGLWEAAVKSLKFHLTRILDQQPLTYEELSTIAIRVEAVLNSRPLCPLSSDPDEFDVLTPGHFLIGEPLLALPCRDYTDLQVNSLSRRQFLQKCVEDLWRRWRSDYLSGLQHRVKWKENRPNIKKDTLVLITDKKVPPLMWPLGRIIDVFPGQDGVIRVVKIRTPTGEYLRPIARLAPLLPQEASV